MVRLLHVEKLDICEIREAELIISRKSKPSYTTKQKLKIANTRSLRKTKNNNAVRTLLEIDLRYLPERWQPEQRQWMVLAFSEAARHRRRIV